MESKLAQCDDNPPPYSPPGTAPYPNVGAAATAPSAPYLDAAPTPYPAPDQIPHPTPRPRQYPPPSQYPIPTQPYPPATGLARHGQPQGYGQPPAGYPPQPGFATPQHVAATPPHQRQQQQQQQQQRQQQVVVVNTAQQQQTTVVRHVKSYTGHIVFSCFVFWCCNPLFGLIAFILAAVANCIAVSEPENARRHGKASLGLSITGIVLTVIAGIIIVVMRFVVIPSLGS